jgi:hypothetical protein
MGGRMQREREAGRTRFALRHPEETAMADEREGAQSGAKSPANEDKLQTRGRDDNAARPLNTSPDRGGPERYPPADRTDAVEPRSFDPAADAPTPRQGAGDGGAPPARNEGFEGPGGDPAEGKR